MFLHGKCQKMHKSSKSHEILANYENQQFPDSKEANLMKMISLKEADKSNDATSKVFLNRFSCSVTFSFFLAKMCSYFLKLVNACQAFD